MSELKVKIDADRAVARLKNFREELPGTSKRFLEESLEFARRKLRERIPVDTENLWESVEDEMDEKHWKLLITAPYAKHVEFPTRESKGRYIPGKYLEKPYYSKKDRYKGEERGIRLKKNNPRAGTHPGTEGEFFRRDTFRDLVDALPEKWGIEIENLIEETEE